MERENFADTLRAAQKLGKTISANSSFFDVVITELDELKRYRDTGLEPEEITTKPYGCVFYCNRKCNLDGDWCAEGPGFQKEMDKNQIAHLRDLLAARQDTETALSRG